MINSSTLLELNEHKNTEDKNSFIDQINEMNREPEITYEGLNNLILSLNTQQRQIFNAVQDWSRKKNQSYEF